MCAHMTHNIDTYNTDMVKVCLHVLDPIMMSMRGCIEKSL